MLRKFSLGLAVLALSASALADDVYYVIAHAGPGDPYWSIQARGAQDAAKKLGIRVVFSAPDTPGDVAKQVELLNAAISANPAGIATTIPDARAFEKPIQRAAQRGIPVVALNTRELKRDPVALPYQAYIGMDELEAGKKVALHALEKFPLKKGDSVVVANHQPGVMSLELRTRGIREILSAHGVKVAALDISSNPTRAISVIQSYLKAHPSTRAVFALGPLGYVPAGRVIRDQKLAGKVQLAGFDIDPVGFDLIRDGIMAFTIDAQPYVQAFMAVNQLYLAAKYKATAVDLDTGVGFLDRSNADKLAGLIQRGYQ